MSTPPNRRLGKRFPVQPVEVRWRVPGPKPKGLFRRAPASQESVAIVHDVSVSGASIIAPVTDDLQVGSAVRIGALGTVGDVVIRRIGEHHQPGAAVYGVEFADTFSDLAKAVHDSFISGNSAIPNWQSHDRQPPR